MAKRELATGPQLRRLNQLSLLVQTLEDGVVYFDRAFELLAEAAEKGYGLRRREGMTRRQVGSIRRLCRPLDIRSVGSRSGSNRFDIPDRNRFAVLDLPSEQHARIVAARSRSRRDVSGAVQRGTTEQAPLLRLGGLGVFEGRRKYRLAVVEPFFEVRRRRRRMARTAFGPVAATDPPPQGSERAAVRAHRR
jgi:hypothetical protein